MTREETSRKNMKDTGIRIKEYDVASVYEYNYGVQLKPTCKQELFTNSCVLVEFLLKNGLIIKKDGTTNDIVSLDFSRGALSIENRIKWFEEKENEKYKSYIDNLKRNSRISFGSDLDINDFKPLTKEELREKMYKDGFVLYNKSKPTIYRRLYRSSGLAKKGKCIFIKERLYEKVRDFMKMHSTDIENKEIKLVEMETYMSLISSKNESKIQIDPNNILILKDVDSTFKTTVLSVEKDDNGHLIANKKDNYEVKNTLFDGQGLISTSLFDEEHKKGFVLLRQHMFKVACFKTNIELFFKDKFGEDWENVELTDMFGRKIKAKNVKLITTDNAIKWKKFDEFTIDSWIRCVNETDNWFGIVKSDHKSKDDDLQRMSYQMINSLDYGTITDEFRYSTRRYLLDLKKDNDLFLKYLKNHASSSNRNGAMYVLANKNKNIMNTSIFKLFRSNTVSKMLKDAKSGRIFQNGDNLTFVGSPYAMLLHAIGEDVENDDTLKPEKDIIQCYTTRFANNKKLAVFRSPHNAQNNIGYLHNVYSDKMQRYFSFSDNIMAINVRHTDFQDRLNGCDFDSDMGFVTDQHDIVLCAKKCYKKCHTIVNNVSQITKKYKNNMENYAKVDNQIASSQSWIGESSNLSQLSQTYMHTTTDKTEKKRYANICAILSVVAQIAIDSAKRSFDIDVTKEIDYLRKQLNVMENGYPKFWAMTHSGFDHEKINIRLRCPMGRLESLQIPKSYTKTVDIKTILKDIPLEKRAKTTAKALMRKLYNGYVRELASFESRLQDSNNFNYTKEDFNRDNYTLRQQMLYDCVKRYGKKLNGNIGKGVYSYILSLIFETEHLSITNDDKKWYDKMTENVVIKGKLRTALLNVLIDINAELFAGAIKEENEN